MVPSLSCVCHIWKSCDCLCIVGKSDVAINIFTDKMATKPDFFDGEIESQPRVPRFNPHL